MSEKGFKNLRRYSTIRRRLARHLEEYENKLKNYNGIELLKENFRRFNTLKIRSENSKRIYEFKDLANSFLFNISYNKDISITKTEFVDEIINSRRISRVRKAEIEKIDPPRKKYTNDLVYHYQLAISSNSHILEFLSFYHIMEYFFERVYDEDMFKSITEKITNPAFSYNRDDDLRELIDLIKNRLHLKEEEFRIDEEEALRLTLEKYIDVDDIRDKIVNYDEDLINHYKRKKVSFSEGNKVNLENDDKEAILSNLTRRIYKTRNSIIHSKEGRDSRYKPFTHEKELYKEIPLMRFIAESIIINEGEAL